VRGRDRAASGRRRARGAGRPSLGPVREPVALIAPAESLATRDRLADAAYIAGGAVAEAAEGRPPQGSVVTLTGLDLPGSLLVLAGDDAGAPATFARTGREPATRPALQRHRLAGDPDRAFALLRSGRRREAGAALGGAGARRRAVSGVDAGPGSVEARAALAALPTAPDGSPERQAALAPIVGGLLGRGAARPSRNGVPMPLGCARASRSDDQDPAAQVRALEAAGCRKVLREAASGGRWDRPEPHRFLDQPREGDAVAVWRLDRLSRSLKDTLAILGRIEAAGAGFRSIAEAVDTTGPAGRMMTQMLGASAEFGRAMTRERARAGLAAARAQGRKGGRRPKPTPPRRAEALETLEAGRKSAAEVARPFGVHPAAVGRLASRARSRLAPEPRRAASGR
jgi:DNA invertase Pin-like site-specific DNA recombinase